MRRDLAWRVAVPQHAAPQVEDVGETVGADPAVLLGRHLERQVGHGPRLDGVVRPRSVGEQLTGECLGSAKATRPRRRSSSPDDRRRWSRRARASHRAPADPIRRCAPGRGGPSSRRRDTRRASGQESRQYDAHLSSVAFRSHFLDEAGQLRIRVRSCCRKPTPICAVMSQAPRRVPGTRVKSLDYMGGVPVRVRLLLINLSGFRLPIQNHRNGRRVWVFHDRVHEEPAIWCDDVLRREPGLLQRAADACGEKRDGGSRFHAFAV